MVAIGGPGEDVRIAARRMQLSQVLREVDLRAGSAIELPVLSLTKDRGLILQSDRFKKRIATDDVSQYKRVSRGQIVYNPYVIWEGAVHALRRFPVGLVSPVYVVWDVVGADPWYVDELLRSETVLAAYQALSSGAVNRRRSISKRDFLSIQIDLPSLPQQHATARILLTVQKTMEASHQVLQATSCLKASALAAFIGGLSSSQYPSVAIGECVTVSSGGTPSRSNPEFWNGTVPWVKTGEINYRYITSTGERITEAGLERIGGRVYGPGTVLVAMYGNGVTRGRAAILGISAAINQACAALTPKSSALSTEYLYYSLEHSYEPLRQLGHGAHQKNLNADLIRSIAITLPPLQHQREIVVRLKSIDAKLAAERQRVEALSSLFSAARNELLAGGRPAHPL